MSRVGRDRSKDAVAQIKVELRPLHDYMRHSKPHTPEIRGAGVLEFGHIDIGERLAMI